MIYRTLGNSDLRLSAIAFGAWAIGGWMWGGADENEALDAIARALDLGMSTIDTAPVYGFGHSETLVGKAVAGKRDKVQILTKYGLSWETTQGKFYFDSVGNDGKPVRIHRYAAKQRVLEECEASLRRLGTDYIDLLQIHWPDPTTPVEETMEAVALLLQQGKIRAAGVCNYSSDLLAHALKSVPIVSDQVAYSMVNRGIESELVPFCVDNQVAIIAYSPLQRGLLTGKISPGYSFNTGDHRAGNPFFFDDNVVKVNAFLDSIRPIAQKYGATISQLVLNWTIHQPGVAIALAGARNPVQVNENAAAADFVLSSEDLAAIRNRLDNLQLTV